MSGNAATLIALVLVAFCATGSAADAHLRKPASAAASPPQPASPVAVVAKVATKPVVAKPVVAKPVVAKAAVVEPVAKAALRVQQPKQFVAKVTAVKEVASKAIPHVLAELHEAEEQAKSKIQELKVQAGLVKEKKLLPRKPRSVLKI